MMCAHASRAYGDNVQAGKFAALSLGMSVRLYDQVACKFVTIFYLSHALILYIQWKLLLDLVYWQCMWAKKITR